MFAYGPSGEQHIFWMKFWSLVSIAFRNMKGKIKAKLFKQTITVFQCET
jgi:hypothetical protein